MAYFFVRRQTFGNRSYNGSGSPRSCIHAKRPQVDREVTWPPAWILRAEGEVGQELIEEKERIVEVPLPEKLLHAIDAVCALEKTDRSQLLKELIEAGLRERTIRLYQKSKITIRKGAEILEISLREFLELLEERRVPINWTSERIGNT